MSKYLPQFVCIVSTTLLSIQILHVVLFYKINIRMKRKHLGIYLEVGFTIQTPGRHVKMIELI